MYESSCCSTPLPAFDVVGVPDFGYSNRCAVVSCFNLHFPDDNWCGASFSMLICHLCIFFGEVSVKILAHFLIGLFVFLLQSIKKSLHVLDNSPLSDVSFASNFSPVCGFSSNSLDIDFHRAEALILMRFSSSVLSFMDHVFGTVSKKASSYPRSYVFSYVIF